MSGLCHSSELTLRNPQMITMDSLDTQELSGACWAGGIFHLAHGPLCRTSSKGAEGTCWHSGQQCQGQRLEFGVS